jgi:hypothetical protein
MASVAPAIDVQAPPQAPFYRFTVEQYHRMIETGVLTNHDRVELKEGWVVSKVTHNPPHAFAVWLLQNVLSPRLPAEWIMRAQLPITLTDSEPEPDVVVARGPGSRYATHHPHPRDIALVVEVADTSLAEDRELNCRIYARARIPVHWIVNIPEKQVEVYTIPRAGKSPEYRHRQDYGPESTILLVLAGQEIAAMPARELLPPSA